MSGTRKLLIFGGLALALWGMGWGLAYAVFFEHQMLDRMGGQISSGFMHAAERNMPAADAALGAYAHSQFNYVRQVDVHSHWIGLAMVLIVLGIAFDRLAFDDRKRFCLALLLVVGSVIFPLGVILQTVTAGALPSALAVTGAALVTVGLAGAVLGFVRQSST